MSLSSQIQQLYTFSRKVAYRPPATYAVGAHTIFTIVGGPVWIHGLFFHATTALAAASTMTIAICGVAADSAVPTNVNTAVGGVCVWPLQAANPPVPNASSNPMPTLAALLAGSFGQLASPGAAAGDNIVVTVGAANVVGLPAWYCVYSPMHQTSIIN